MKEYGDTFLLAPFREFYREVIRLRRMVVTGAQGMLGAATVSYLSQLGIEVLATDVIAAPVHPLSVALNARPTLMRS